MRAEDGRAPLTEADVAVLAPGARPDVVRAIWAAARGNRAAVEAMVRHLAQLPDDVDPVVAVALRLPGAAEFLDVDVAAVRLLEIALERSGDPAERALLMAALARELMGDVSTLARRRELIDSATELALAGGDDHVLGYVLDAQLHALWQPDPTGSRLATADRIVRGAQTGGDAELEARGVFWRFVSLVETGRVGEAESALATFERLTADDPAAQLMALARHGMLAVLRGRYDFARAVVEQLRRDESIRDLPDAQRLVGALLGGMSFAVGTFDQGEAFVEVMHGLARRFPGHYYDASTARLHALLGQRDEAIGEIDRGLPSLLAGSGPRWLGAMADASAATAMVGHVPAAGPLYDALAPHAGGFVIWAGANMVEWPVDTHLGALALCMGRAELAIEHLNRARELQEYAGALPGLVHTLAVLADAFEARNEGDDREGARATRERARSLATQLGMQLYVDRLAPAGSAGGDWALLRDGVDWLLSAGEEQCRLRDMRGLHYLRALLASPRHEIAATQLVAGGELVAATSGADAVVDGRTVAAYRARLAVIDGEADAADRRGDAGRARELHEEREALLAELRGATGLGGRIRDFSSDAERARVSVTKALRVALDRIEEQAPLAAAHLRASLRTGRHCRYDPAPGGPAGWRT